MVKALPFCVAYMYPILLLLVINCHWWSLVLFMVTFILFPILNLTIGLPAKEDQLESEKDNPIFKFILWFWVPVQLTLMGYVMWWILQEGRTLLDIATVTLSIGFINGLISIVFAHELLHATDKVSKFLALVLMLTVNYPYFLIEHVLGHHKNVATKLDLATADFNESFYNFYYKVLCKTPAYVWDIETKNLSRFKLPLWKNRVIWYSLLTVVINILMYVILGGIAIAFFIAQGFIAFTNLQLINYIEHYGLSRKIHEPVLPQHAWNDSHNLTNWLLINLSKHSDHHCHVSKQYQILTNTDSNAPQLPFDYSIMYPLALLPSAWFKVMNHRITQDA